MRSVECMSTAQGTNASSFSSLKKLVCASALALATTWSGVSWSPSGRALAVAPPPPQKVNDQFFDWFDNMTPGYLPAPHLTNQNRDAVNAILEQHKNQPLAVIVEKPISNQTAQKIFNNS